MRSGWGGRPSAEGESTLLLAPTGSGKTLAAFLHAIDRLMFEPAPQEVADRCKVLYVSPLKALAVDVERNLRAPIAGITRLAAETGVEHRIPAVAVRTGDTPARERVLFGREAADILITTPESLYLLLTSNARDRLRAVETVIVDEIHALVPSKRGAHLMLSLERLEALANPDGTRPLQRVGLSATQRPLDEVARFLGGVARPQERGGRIKAPARPSTSAARTGKKGPQKASAAPGPSAAETLVRAELAAADAGGVGVRYRPVTIVDAGHTQGARAAHRGAGRGHGGAGQAGRRPQRPGGAGARARLDLDGDPPAPASSWCASTGRRSSSSTAAASPSGWPPP